MKNLRGFILFAAFFLFLNFVSASTYEDCRIYGTCKEGITIQPNGNYTINVNNTDNFGGYSVSQYANNYLTSLNLFYPYSSNPNNYLNSSTLNLTNYMFRNGSNANQTVYFKQLEIYAPNKTGFTVQAGGPGLPTFRLKQSDYNLSGTTAIRSDFQMENNQLYFNGYDDVNSVYIPASWDFSSLNLQTNGGTDVNIGFGATSWTDLFNGAGTVNIQPQDGQSGVIKIGGMEYSKDPGQAGITYMIQRENNNGNAYGSILAFYSNNYGGVGSSINLGFDGEYYTSVAWDQNGMWGGWYGSTAIDNHAWGLFNEDGHLEAEYIHVGTSYGNYLYSYDGYSKLQADGVISARGSLVLRPDTNYGGYGPSMDFTAVESGGNNWRMVSTGNDDATGPGWWNFYQDPYYSSSPLAFSPDRRVIVNGNAGVDNGVGFQVYTDSYLFNEDVGSTAQYIIANGGYAVTSYEPYGNSSRAFIFGYYPTEFTSRAYDEAYSGFNSGTSINIINNVGGKIVYTAKANNFTGNVTINDNLNQTKGNATINNIYGEMYNKSDSGFETVDLVTQDVYVRVKNLSCGENNGVLCSGGNLTVLYQGLYKVDAVLSSSDGASGEHGFKIFLNETGQDKCYNHEHATTTAKPLAISCYVRVNATHNKISLRIDDHANPVNDITLYATNVNLLRVGN